jgi:succinate dehydrogenase/fumarate reductase flavoprotein subunit
MIAYLEKETKLQYLGIESPDYYSENPHASVVRTASPVSCTAREIGPISKLLKDRLPQSKFLGLGIGGGAEMRYFQNATRSREAMAYVVRKMFKHFAEVAFLRQSQQIAGGRALVARLARALIDLGTPIWSSSPIERLITKDGMVLGAKVRTPRGLMRVFARYGVVLACGGFGHDIARREQVFPASAARARNPTSAGNTGDGIRISEEAGGVFGGGSQPAAWMPVSAIPGSRGAEGVAVHLTDSQRPGFIAVLRNGRRFANESQDYHQFTGHLIASCKDSTEALAWIVGDRKALRRWGLGMVRPFPLPHGAYLRSGYLLRGRTIRELALNAQIDEVQLEETVRSFNAYAVQGVDPEFGRGGRIYDTYHGDAAVHPNRCLAPLTQAPFFAVRVQAGIIGTFAGVKTNAQARAITARGDVIPGLYVVGNDQANVFAGFYPGGGATLGPAMTFGYIAGKHLAQEVCRSRSNNGLIQSAEAKAAT